MSHLTAALVLLASGQAVARKLDIDLVQQYGAVSLASINHAIKDAHRHFEAAPDDTIIVHLPPGVFGLAETPDKPGGIDVSGLQPSYYGRFILQGAGKAATTLVFNGPSDEILGRNATHVSFVGLHFTVGHMTVSQGHVLQVLPGAVVLRIEKGFPSPADLFDPESDRGRYLRRCDEFGGRAQINQDPDNLQVAWSRTSPLSDRDWRIDVRLSRSATPFRLGDLLAIKSKNKEGGAYRFIGGSDIVFSDVAWSRVTRGVFRGTNGVRVSNASILRDEPVDGHVPCLASAGGGPQIGQPRDPPIANVTVENFTAAGTGDDSLAFFNAAGAIRHVSIQDSFARGILLYSSPNVVLEDIRVDRAPVLRN